MAIQARYPSNVQLPNRNVQEGHPLQQHPGGIFLDKSHAATNNGGITNQRKRVREEYCGGVMNNNIAGLSSSPMHVYTVSPQPQQQPLPQIIDLTQLHSNSESTGLRLASTDQQRYQQHQYHKVEDGSPAISDMFNQDLATYARKQRDEMDQFIHTQGEQLRRILAEMRQRNYRALLGAAEESLARRLREKDAEIEKARRRNGELRARAAHLGAAAQVWQAKAMSQEAAAASLRCQLQQAMMGGERKLDAVSEPEGQAAEDAESVYEDPERTTWPSASGPSCKECRKRAATVLLLPCRHLSLCRECERVAWTCPICCRAKSSSIEVFLSPLGS